MGGGQWMVVLVVAIVVIGRIVRTRMQHDGHASRELPSAEEQALRGEVRALKERLAVLERIATDGNTTLERQIEALRDDRPAPRRLDDDFRRDRADNREG